MSMLLENPIPIFALGAVAITLTGLAFFNRRSLPSLVALIVAVLTVISLLGLEKLVVTDREQVEQGVAASMLAIEQNDLAGLLALVDLGATAMRSDIETMLPEARIEDTGFTSLEVTLSGEDPKLEAEATFKGRVDGAHKRSGHRIFYFDVVKLYWTKSGGRWLLTDYQPYWQGKAIDAVGSMRSNRPVGAK